MCDSFVCVCKFLYVKVLCVCARIVRDKVVCKRLCVKEVYVTKLCVCERVVCESVVRVTKLHV